MQIASKALVALGSNATSRYGDPVRTVLGAIEALTRDGMSVSARSRLYRTPFVPRGAGADVINAAVVLETDLDPVALLAELNRLETAFDRERSVRWGSRTLDLDLLLMDDRILPDAATFRRWQGLAPAQQARAAPAALVLPHPRMAERAFVLVPAAEVAPRWRHPVLGKTISQLLAALPDDEVAVVKALAV